MRTLLVSSLFIVFLFPVTVHALSISYVTPFGGKIDSISVCTCIASPALILKIKPVGRGNIINLLWQPPFVTRPYKWYVPYPGLNTLGLYIRGGVCLMQAYPTCTQSSENVDGTITKIGTSRNPSGMRR